MAAHRGRPPYDKPYQDREGRWKIWKKGDESPKFLRRPPEPPKLMPSTTPVSASQPNVSHAAVDIGSVLGNWAAESQPDGPNIQADTSATASPIASPVESAESFNLSSMVGEPVQTEPPKPRKKKGLTDEQREKLKSSMGEMAARANVMLLGIGVRTFGKRQPELPEDKDTELLNLAWTLQLEEWFGSAKVEPWVLIAGASATLAAGMWFNGEPLPDKPKLAGNSSAKPPTSRDLPPNNPAAPDYAEARVEGMKL